MFEINKKISGLLEKKRSLLQKLNKVNKKKKNRELRMESYKVKTK